MELTKYLQNLDENILGRCLEEHEKKSGEKATSIYLPYWQLSLKDVPVFFINVGEQRLNYYPITIGERTRVTHDTDSLYLRMKL